MDNEERRELEEDLDLKYLKMKTQDSLSNVINEILENETIKKAISQAVIKQSLITGLFLSCLIVGILTLVNAVKTLCNFTWQADLIVGMILIILGSVYITKKLNM